MHLVRGWVMICLVCGLLIGLGLCVIATRPATGLAAPAVPPSQIAVVTGQPVPPAPPLMSPPRSGVTYAASPDSLDSIITDPVVDMKVLVLHKTGDADGVFQTIRAYLDVLGVPYDVIDTGLSTPAGTVEEGDLWNGASHGYYQAIFISTSNVWFAYLDATERSLIAAYERSFAVREVTCYAYPDATEYGLVNAGVAPLPLAVSLTAAGQAVFSYLQPGATMLLQTPDVYAYLAQPANGADVTSLMAYPNGDTLLAVNRRSDGREQLVFTASSYYPTVLPSNVHARLLPYGFVNWATRGLFLGERHVYFVPQPDDFLAWGDRWDPAAHRYVYDTGYRNAPGDLENLYLWTAAFRAGTPNAAGFMIEMPFNSQDSFESDPPEVVDDLPVPGTLTAKAAELQAGFAWLNHTYSHRDLDFASYATCVNEIATNSAKAVTLGFTDYSQVSLLTGGYSGLTNPNLALAAYDQGVRYLEVDTSRPGYNNPTPNTGIPHPTQPDILQVPRYPTNIFYAVTNPVEEADLYNVLYCSGYPASQACFSYDDILDRVTFQALGFMLDFSVDATMFHMNNLDAYDEVYDGSGRTLLGDFVESLYGKYNAYYAGSVPVLSLRTHEIGQRMRARMAYNASGVTGELACGGQITLHTESAATIPVTGLSYGSQVESYAGQAISAIAMGPNETRVIAGATPSVPAAIVDLAATRSGADVILSWSATTVDTNGAALGALVYRVYAHAGDPDFTPTTTDLVAEVTEPVYVHTGGASDATTLTYVVTAIGDNCWKRESAPSNRLTKFVWTVRPGYNLLAIPLVPSANGIQSVLGAQLTGGSSIAAGDQVLKFDPLTQQYDQVAIYVDGTGTYYDGSWYDVVDFPNHLSAMTFGLHDGYWVLHRGADTRLVVTFGRAAGAAERSLAMIPGPYQLFGTALLEPLTLNQSNLWESGATGGDSIFTGDRILHFDAVTQSYASIAVLIDGTNTSLDGTWVDALAFPNPSQLQLEPGQGYWFHNQAPSNAFLWTYPRP